MLCLRLLIFYQCSEGTRVQPVLLTAACLYSFLMQESNPTLLSVFCFFFHLSFSLLIFPSFLPSLSMPWVGGNRRRWEVRAQVCAGNHGNPVLIGQWPGRMIVSCCQWGLFMQTGSSVGRPQMGPSNLRRRGTRRRIYSLYLQFEPWNQKLKLLLKWMSSLLLGVCVPGVCLWTVCVYLCETLLPWNNSISHLSKSPKMTCLCSGDRAL